MKPLIALLLLTAHQAGAQIVIVSAASQSRDAPVTPDSIATIYGQRLATATESARSLPLPRDLGGTSVTITDTQGAQQPASLFFASPGQLNILMPTQLASGQARVSVRAADGTVSTGAVEIRAVSPAVFTANGAGRGVAAGLALRVAADGSRITTFLARLASDGRTFAADPVDLGAAGDQVYLMLFGTGIRRATTVSATVAGGSVPVLGAAAQSETPGLDQVNIGPVPRSLAGRGEVDIVISADATRANIVTSSFRLPDAGPAAGQWGTRAPLIEPNSETAIAELDGKIYVIGGYPSSRNSVATVQVYDSATDTWSLTTPLPGPINHAMAAAVNGKLYLIGGQSDANVAYVNTVYEYDPATTRWRARAPMPTARSSGVAAVIDGRIYVAGGRPPRGADFAVYDPAADQWQTLPNLPTQRNHLLGVALGGKMYVIGGRFEGGANSPQTDAVEVFDPATGQWSRRSPMLKPRGGINGVIALGCVHVFGGEGSATDPNGVYPDHDVNNPVTDSWSRLGPMPTPVHGVTGAAFLNGLIHLPGGGTAMGGSSGSVIHQVYRPAASCQ